MDRCSTISDRVAFAAEAIRRQWSCTARVAIVLGTGLGDLADEMAVSASFDYGGIPGFPHSTAPAHRGRLLCGEMGGAPVMMMQGRCHLYEGYSLDDVTLPVRVFAALGIETLIVTNAAGGLDPDFVMGDVMRIDDHISLMWLGGMWSLNSATAGRIARPRERLYDRGLAQLAATAASRHDFPLHGGTYVAVTGPSYETRAEYRAFRRLGGDCVGMSTVPEVLAATALGLRVLGLSTITNVACPDAPKKVSAEEVIEVARIARPRVGAIVNAVVGSYR